MREIDEIVIKAQKDKDLFEKLILENEFFIIRTTSKITNKYINKSDDEWSIALNAFNEAVSSYNMDKGSFYSFAELVIKRRIIDYLRKESKRSHEILVDSYEFHGNDEEDNIIIKKEVITKTAHTPNDDIKLEIEGVTEEFKAYGFSFFDLIEVSPKAEKTKAVCKKVIVYILENQILHKELIENKRLPLKIIEKNIKVPRKILERHRKYIIAAVVIISGDYPHLAEYMSFIREEMTR